MSHVILHLHGFECDHDGCNARALLELGLRDAVRKLRSNHWTITKDRKHYCPEHAPVAS